MECPVCGKPFFVGDRGAYVFKHIVYTYKKGKFSGYHGTAYFCGWTCFRKAEKQNFIYEVK